MSAPKNIIPSRDLHLMLPEDLKTRLDLLLYSEVEQRIPKGEYQRFICARLREYFTNRQFDLAPYLPGVSPGSFTISGNAETLAKLIDLLKGES